MNEQNLILSEQINEFEEDSKWFYENIDLLRTKNLVGKFVAIKNKEIIASDEKMSIVIEAVEKKRVNPAYVFIEYVYSEGTVILL